MMASDLAPFPIPFSEWVISAAPYWSTPAKRRSVPQTNPLSLVVRPPCTLIRSPLPEHHHGQGRQRHGNTIRTVVTGFEPAGNQPAIADIRSAEKFRIGVQYLFVKALFRYADFIALARHRGEVATDQQEIRGVFGAAQERNHGVFRIAEIHPFETAVMEIHLVKRRAGAVEAV